MTNLNDSGTGSLRRIVEMGIKNIRFEVDGYITLTSDITITTSGTVIDGTGANIGIKGASIVVDAPDVTLRNLRIRPGLNTPHGWGVFGTERSDGLVMEHCSVSWNTDANTFYGKNTVIRWCIFSEPLPPVETPEQPASIERAVHWMTAHADNMLFHHNLIAHSFERNPGVDGGSSHIINNVMYNCAQPAWVYAYWSPVLLNFIGNTNKPGVDVVSRQPMFQYALYILEPFDWRPIPFYDDTQVYVLDNTCPARTVGDSSDENAVHLHEREKLVSAPPVAIPVAYTSAAHAYDDVLASAGAQPRDAIDARIVADVVNGTGHIIADPAEVEALFSSAISAGTK